MFEYKSLPRDVLDKTLKQLNAVQSDEEYGDEPEYVCRTSFSECLPTPARTASRFHPLENLRTMIGLGHRTRISPIPLALDLLENDPRPWTGRGFR